MTKVQLTFKLAGALDDDNLKQIARVHAVYGILAARPLATGDGLFVEFDASRLSPKEVRAVLERHGIAVA